MIEKALLGLDAGASKLLVVEALKQAMRADLDAMLTAARAAHDAATHEEAKPENDKDTRATEAGYLAGAQSARAAELKQQLDLVERADISAFSLVSYQQGKAQHTVLLSLWGGGIKLAVGGDGNTLTISVVTPQSPIGRALHSAQEGDDVEVDVGGSKRELLVTARV